MNESKIRSSILLLVINLVLLCFIGTSFLLISRGYVLTLVLISGLIHLAILLFCIVLAFTISKRIFSSFTDFLSHARLDQEELIHVGEFFGLAEKALSQSPPALINTSSIEGRAKNLANQFNSLVKDLNNLSGALSQMLKIAPHIYGDNKAADFAVFINNLADDLEAISKGNTLKGNYDQKLKAVLDAIQNNYSQLAESHKFVSDITEALKKNNTSLLPKDKPLAEEIAKLMKNISDIDGALSHMAGFNLEPAGVNPYRGTKTADTLNSIQTNYKSALKGVFEALDAANVSAASLAGELRVLSNINGEDKRLVSQLKDAAKSAAAQVKISSDVNAAANSKIDDILQLSDKINSNKESAVKSSEKISGFSKDISSYLNKGFSAIMKFKFSGAVRTPVTAYTAKPEVRAVNKTRPLSRLASEPLKAGAKAKALKPSAMMPGHHGKIPDSGYNFDSKDYGKYSR